MPERAGSDKPGLIHRDHGILRDFPHFAVYLP